MSYYSLIGSGVKRLCLVWDVLIQTPFCDCFVLVIVLQGQWLRGRTLAGSEWYENCHLPRWVRVQVQLA